MHRRCTLWPCTLHTLTSLQNNNKNNTIWRGSVVTGVEPPLHSGELKHALTQAGGPTQSQPSRPMSSRHHISMEHRLRRKHLLLNPSTRARSGIYVQRKKQKHIFQEKQKIGKMKKYGKKEKKINKRKRNRNGKEK